MDSLKKQFIIFKNLPFPQLGKVIGDFGLYDSLMAGTIDSYLKRKTIKEDEIPLPNEETISEVIALRNKTELSEDEKEFLLYFDMLETMRSKLTDLVRTEDSK